MIFSEHQNVEKEICVCLNDEETRILFVDQKHGDMSVSQRLKSNFVVAESTVFIFTSLQDFCIDFGNANFSVYFPSSLEDGKHYTQVSGK